MKKTVGWLKLLSLGLVISLILSQMALVRADVVESQTPTETTVTAENSEARETEKSQETTVTSAADTEANAKQSALLFDTQSLELSSENSDQEELKSDSLDKNNSEELQSDVTTSSQDPSLQNTDKTVENSEENSAGNTDSASNTTSSSTSSEQQSNGNENGLPSDSSQSGEETNVNTGESTTSTSSHTNQQVIEDEAGKKATAAAEKLAKEEADKKAKEEADKKAKEEADKKAKEAADKKAAEEEAAKQAELALYEYTPMGIMPANGYPVDQDSLILATQFNGTSTNGQSTFDSVGQLWTYNGMVYVSVLTNMGTSTLYLGPGNALPQVSKDELGALEPLLIDHDNNPATAAISYPVGGTSGSTKKEHWSVFRYNLSDFLGLMQANPSNSFLLTLVVGQGHWIAGYFTVVLPVVTANLTKTWLGGPMTPVTLNLYRKIEGGTEQLYDTVTLSATNGTATHQWTNLAYTNLAGQRWIYRIDEADPGQGYDADFSSTYDAATRTYTFTLTNTYILTPKQFVIRGRKTIDTRPIAAGETFTMQLYASDANGTQGAMISSATTQGDGSFAFPAITYQVAGTFYYLVKEVPGSKPGMTYDVTPKLVAVNVVDNNDGTLSISMSPAAGASVENKYQAQPVTVPFAFMKKLSGRSLLGGEFSFSIYRSLDGSGATVGDALQTVSNNADGSVSFNLTYTDGQEGLYHYTIKENLSDPANGVTHLTTLLVYTVNIYDDNNGHLQYTLYPPSDPTFYNAYKAADTSLTLRATKSLNGRALKAGEFQFELLDDQGTVIRTATNDANGNIVFSPAISYSDKDLISGNNQDTYTYTVREVEPDPKLGGVSYDKGVKTLTVNVLDNGDGSMTASVVGTAVFTNVYTTVPLTVPLPVTKTLTGRTGTTVRDRFTFTLNGANEQSLDFYGNDTKNFYYYLNYTLADLEGAVSKVFEYTVAELNTPAIPGMVYDSDLDDVVRVTVRDKGDGTLGYTLNGTAAFANRYQAADTKLTIRGTKTLTGRTGIFSDVFRFSLDDANGQVLTFTQNGTQNFSFAEKTYTFADLAGQAERNFTYILKELSDDYYQGTYFAPIPGIVYDPEGTRTLTVNLKDMGNGTLSATLTGNTDYVNKYEASSTMAAIFADKTLVGRTGEFLDSFRFELNGEKADSVTTEVAFTSNGTKPFYFSFGPFTFADLAGQNSKDFIYTLTELTTNPIAGINYDPNPTRTVKLTLRDNGDGTLSTIFDSRPSFVNSYGAVPVIATVNFSKELRDRLGSYRDRFDFVLTPQTEGDPNEQKNAPLIFTANGSLTGQFPPLTYTLTDLGGAPAKVFTYELEETTPTNTAIKPVGPTTFLADVTVADDGDGNLTTSISYRNTDGAAVESANFVNRYEATPIKISVVGNKTLSGRSGIFNDAFKFSLAGPKAEAMAVQELSFNANGTLPFTFSEIEYTQADMEGSATKSFVYTVTESADPIISGIVYDPVLTRQVSVTVSDDGQGKLSARLNSQPAFTNRYETTPISIAIPYSKTLNSRTGDFEDTYLFTLTKKGETDPLEIRQLDFSANGTQSDMFTALTFTKADLGNANSKVFDYIVAELDGGIDGITYDSRLQRNISIIVKDLMDGTLSAEIVDGTDNSQAYDTAFSNEYEAEPVSVPLGISKMLSGRTGTFSDTFQFRLSPVPEVAGQDVIGIDAELNFTENGSKIHSFEALQFSLADLGGESSKTFKYKLEEIIPDTPIPGMVYDTQAVREISITVTDNGLGQLLANVDLGENPNEGNNIHFSNTYKASPISITLKGKKQLLGRTGTFSDAYTFSLDDLQTKALFFTENNTQSFSFNPLSYTLADLGPSGEKVFTYKVTEEGFPAIPGMVYDANATQTINVRVTDNGDGTLSAVADREVSYVNEYMAEPVDLIISGSKTLLGRSGEFSDSFLFTLNGEQTQELNFQANGSKDFAFAPITYTLEDLGGASEKTFEYSVAELVPPTLEAIPGITYDANPVRKVLVTLKDNGNGTLSAQADIKPSFTNLYGTGTAAATIQLKKVLSGRTGSFRDVFRFTLDGQYERELIFTANGEQTLNFPPLQYKLEDLEGAASKTFTYKVAEINDAIPGMIYDSQAEQTVSVTVTDDGQGNLVAAVNELPVFENRYEAKPAELILSAKKTLSGRNGSFSDTFSFSLDGKDVQDVVFTENGTKDFSFSPLSYTFADLEGQNSKSFVFYIKEEVGAPIPGIVYDTELTRPITVILADKGDGTMGFVVSETPNFTNSYVLEESTWTPMANKRLFGLKALEGGDYRFEVNRIGEVEPVSRGINDANGVISFSPITITAADIGESIYEIREVIGTDPNTSYDESVYEVILNVSDNGDGTLAIVPTYPEGGIHFFNLYESVVTHDPPVEKKVTGAGAPTNAVFRFKMEAITPYAPMPEGAVDGEMIREITGSGSFEFGIMSFVAPGTYVYELRELPTTAEHFSTDPTLYTITVHISSDNGLLKKDVVYTMNNGTTPVEALVFDNKYEAPPTPTTTATPSTSKAKPNPIPRTGEAGEHVTLNALALMATAALLFIARKRRKSGEEEQELSDHAE